MPDATWVKFLVEGPLREGLVQACDAWQRLDVVVLYVDADRFRETLQVLDFQRG
jgi:hypothetical protein